MIHIRSPKSAKQCGYQYSTKKGTMTLVSVEVGIDRKKLICFLTSNHAAILVGMKILI